MDNAAAMRSVSTPINLARRRAPSENAPQSPAAVPPPSLWAAQALNFHLDPLQNQILDSSSSHLILCCSRQWGKSTVTAIRTLHHAWFNPGSLILCLAPGARQSGLFLKKAEHFLRILKAPVRKDPLHPLSLVLPNGSRLIALPGDGDTIRGFSAVGFLVLDEAALIPDSLYHAARPFLAVSGGPLWLLSTPAGQSGFFFEEWTRGRHWTRFSAPATACSRIRPEFLEQERASLGDHAFRQEYLCEFLASEHQMIDRSIIDAIIVPEGQPLPADPAPIDARPSDTWFLGLDLGLRRDPTALAVIRRQTRPTGERDPFTWAFKMETVTGLHRIQPFPLQTPYAEISSILRGILTELPKSSSKVLAVDATGAGDPVVELLKSARLDARLVPIVITAGHSVGHLPHADSIPRHTLLNNLRRMIEVKLFSIPSTLPHLDALTRELTSLGNPNSTTHDDLAFSLALSAWLAK